MSSHPQMLQQLKAPSWCGVRVSLGACSNTDEAAVFTQTGKAPIQPRQQRSGDRDDNTASLSKGYCSCEVSAWRLTLAWEGAKQRKRPLPACPGIPAFPWRTAPTHLCLNTAQLPPQWLRKRRQRDCLYQPTVTEKGQWF